MSSFNVTVFFLVCLVCIAFVAAEDISAENSISKVQDLDTSATSAKLFNLGSLFGQYPNYGYGYGSNSYNPNTGYRPTGTYRPSYYYPTTGSGGYYPSSGGYYPSTGWTGSQYPSYYSNTGSGYYPNTGTNILGSSGGYGGYGSGYGYGGGYNDYNRYGGYNDYNRYGGASGYGGYGGNGGLNQYSGYWNPDYTGQRNRGYGYMSGTDRYGLPQRDRDYYDSGRDRDRDQISVGYRGYD